MGLGSSLKKFTKKTFGDYSAFFIPSVEAAISGVSGALSGAATGAAIGGVGAIPGAIIGGVTGVASGSYQKMQSNIAEEAAEDAERAAERQEIMAKAAPTQTASPEAIISQAQQSVAGESSMQKRRYSTGKTTNSGMGLSRLASGSNTGRKTLA